MISGKVLSQSGHYPTARYMYHNHSIKCSKFKIRLLAWSNLLSTYWAICSPRPPSPYCENVKLKILLCFDIVQPKHLTGITFENIITLFIQTKHNNYDHCQATLSHHLLILCEKKIKTIYPRRQLWAEKSLKHPLK